MTPKERHDATHLVVVLHWVGEDAVMAGPHRSTWSRLVCPLAERRLEVTGLQHVRELGPAVDRAVCGAVQDENRCARPGGTLNVVVRYPTEQRTPPIDSRR
jgi:hypothetical protein